MYSQPAPQSNIDEREYWNSIANRVMHGLGFKVFYAAVAGMSLVCLLISLFTTCPPSWFYLLESLIIISMVMETTLRIVAVGQSYWKSLYNIADFGVLILCFVAFLLLLKSDCGNTKSAEAVAEGVLLIGRNVIQFIRLGTMIKRY
jgi:hypothetical protein